MEESCWCSQCQSGAAALPLPTPIRGTHGHRWGSTAGAQGAGAGWRGSPPGWDTADGDSAGWAAPQAAATTGASKQGVGPRPGELSHPCPWRPDPFTFLLRLLRQGDPSLQRGSVSPQTCSSPHAPIPSDDFPFSFQSLGSEPSCGFDPPAPPLQPHCLIFAPVMSLPAQNSPPALPYLSNGGSPMASPGVSSTTCAHPPYTPARCLAASPHSALVLRLTPNRPCWLFVPSAPSPPGRSALSCLWPPWGQLRAAPRPQRGLTHLAGAHLTGVFPRLEALSRLVLPALVLAVWAWGKGRMGPASLHAGNGARSGGGLCLPGTPAPRIWVCTSMGATSGKARLCCPARRQGRGR